VCGSEVAFPLLPRGSLKILVSSPRVGHGRRSDFCVAGNVDKSTSVLTS